MIYQEEQVQRNCLTIFVNIQLNGVERQVTFATHNNTSRLFTVGQFLDNQHYTYLESLLIQNNPKESESIFQLHARIPELRSQRKKILDKFQEIPTKLYEEKLGLGDLQQALTFLLKRPLNMYNKQLENQKANKVLEKLIQLVDLNRDNSNKNQFQLRLINSRAYMMLDKSTINAIQIFPKQMGKKVISANSTLYEIFNRCKTQFGTRCLKRWMKQPLQDVAQLQTRLDKIQCFISNTAIKNIIQNELKKLPDLDRLYFIFYKVAAGKKVKCQVSDLMKIYRVVQSLDELLTNLSDKDINDLIIKEIIGQLKRNVDIIKRIGQLIEKGIDMSGNRDSEFFVRPETQPSLQNIMRQRKQIQSKINQEVNQVAKYLDLQVQKLASNTYKFVLQVNKKAGIDKIKSNPQYKFLSAKVSKITFVTNNLQRLCQRLKVVQDSYDLEQQSLLKKMFQVVAGYYPIMESLSFILSQLDVMTTIATIVSTGTAGNLWCRPTFSSSLKGKAMRHPCVKNCVPNDCQLKNEKTVILTGPNMGGKSTYIRTIGVCTYLAHIGCYVPAVQFETPIIDAIITRVGASDLQVKGISTFMSEMLESSCLLQTATKNSLVLIDELGRGTSTSQGFGIAWGICQYLHTTINPFCLFATHFHEMTRMGRQIKGVKNMHTTCKIQDNLLRLQYKVQEGKTKKSYGIEVMKLLQFSEDVIKTAQDYLDYYESKQAEAENNQMYDQEVIDEFFKLTDELQQKLNIVDPQDHKKIGKEYEQMIRQLLNR